jgi:hypothetical protein
MMSKVHTVCRPHATSARLQTLCYENRDFELEIVPTDGTRLLLFISGDFGTSPFLRSTRIGHSHTGVLPCKAQ